MESGSREVAGQPLCLLHCLEVRALHRAGGGNVLNPTPGSYAPEWPMRLGACAIRVLGRSIAGGTLLVAFALTPAASSLSAPRCTIEGSVAGETLRGTPERDVVCGKGGSDTILGRGGDDILYGGGGRDDIEGGAGDDRILGGDDADELRGGRGADWVSARSGPDDYVGGGPGPDRVRGGRGRDVCLDAVDEVAANDVLVGGTGKDTYQSDEGDTVSSAERELKCTPTDTPPP